MALNLIRKIIIKEDFSSFFADDSLKVYWNDSSEAIEVTKNGSTITNGAVLLMSSDIINADPDTEIDTLWASSETGYSFNKVLVPAGDSAGENGQGLKTYFDTKISFPYASKKTTNYIIYPVEDIPTNDVKIKLVAITEASSFSTLDGKVEVSASGTNSPFEFFDYDPSLYNTTQPTGQPIGLFENLSTGNISIYVRDSEGFIDSVSTYVPIDDSPTLSNYGVKWRVTYDNITETDTYRVSILERGYELSIIDAKGADNPFSLSQRGEGGTVYGQNIISSNVSLSLISTYFNQYKSIVDADEKKFVILLEKYNTNTSLYEQDWLGYVSPSSYTDVLYQAPYEVSITANDRLADLKSYDFVYGDNGSDNFINGNLSHLFIINLCLDKLKLGFNFRVAVNLFASGQDDTSNSPLSQTYIDASVFRSDQGDPYNCDEVVTAILKVYGATLFSYQGYWYIVRQKEWLNETIDYVDYSRTDLSIITSGSWSPRIPFAPPEDNDRFVWVGGAQSRIFTDIYSKVNLITKRILSSDSGNLLPEFNDRNILLDPSGNFLGFKGYFLQSTVVNDNSFSQSISNNVWRVSMSSLGNSDTYITSTGKVSYGTTDFFQLQFLFRVIGSFSQDGSSKFSSYPLYGQFNWELQVGSYYLTESGEWSFFRQINQFFVESFDSDISFERDVFFPTDVGNNVHYSLKVYPVDLLDADINIEYGEDLYAEIRNIATIDIGSGRRLVTRTRNTPFDAVTVNEMRYYELISYDGLPVGSVDSRVLPKDYNTDSNSRVWSLAGVSSLPIDGVEWTDSQGIKRTSSWYTMTDFSKIGFNFKADGQSEIEEEPSISKTASTNNNVELPYEVEMYDLDSSIKNEEKLILNYLRNSDDSPTNNWKESGGTVTKRLQDFVLDWLTLLVKKARAQVSGEIRTDGVELTPINVLYDESDNDRIYLPLGVTSDNKMQQYSGELIEIGSTDDINESAFTNGFKQNAVT